jgi:hypothetical protein
MRRLLFTIMAAIGLQSATAQTVASFESLSLSQPDTFYVNYSDPGEDVGFANGLAWFPCVYDTSWGGIWNNGFAYSNMTDSVSSGYLNQYSAKAGAGYAGSEKYAVAYCYNSVTNDNSVLIKLRDTAIGHPVKGMYVTNSTYAYNSMRDGDWIARKFRNGDFFLLTAKGYYNGTLKTDSVSHYLANFLHPDTADNYILKDWEWMNLEPLGKVDSIILTLRSTDNGSFGMNTPSYFCIDNFTTFESFDTSSGPVSTAHVKPLADVKVYPIPASSFIHADVTGTVPDKIYITNMLGAQVHTVAQPALNNDIDISHLPAGNYVLVISTAGKQATVKFTHQ